MDQTVLDFFVTRRTGTITHILIGLSVIFRPVLVLLWASIISTKLWGMRYALLPLFTAVATNIISPITKHIVHRPRPPLNLQLAPEYNYSMPSGHAMTIIAVATAISLIPHKPRWATRLAGVTWAIAITVCVARLYLGVHWLTDVLAGGLIGAATTLALRWGYSQRAQP